MINQVLRKIIYYLSEVITVDPDVVCELFMDIASTRHTFYEKYHTYFKLDKTELIATMEHS